MRPGLHNLEGDDFGFDLASLNGQSAHTHGKVKPSRARAAGIEIKHTAARLLLRSVTVAGDHGAESRRFGLQIEFRQIVQYVDGNAGDLDCLGFRKFARPCSLIDVAADGGHRRDRCQHFEDLGRAHIARVNDMVGAAQGLDRFGPKQSVGVGDDADEDQRFLDSEV